MKRQLATIFIVSLISLASLSAIRTANAGIDSITWLKPAWKNVTDPFLGDVLIAYVTGTTWMLNVKVYNDATNSTDMVIQDNEKMEAHLSKIAVWFDWNLFYNTTIDVTMKYGTERLFTITNTTEQTSVASNLFTHSYKIYVEYWFSYQEGSGTVTKNETWGPISGNKFAVLSQDQYDSIQASRNYGYFKGNVSSTVDDYSESKGLFIQAEQEATTAALLYSSGEFTGALSHYNTAMSLLNQSYTVAKSKNMQYDTLDLNDYQADIDLKNAEVDAINANATATLIIANAVAQATVVNSIALVFFGLGFMFFGLAAIVYANKRAPKQQA